MSKRANPFVEDFIQQSKVHVGIKQFNNNEHRLQKVYEKTLNLLFKGAKKSVVQDVQVLTDTALNVRKDKMKQLHIGIDGALIHSGVTTSERPASVQHCSCGRSAVDCCCAYCEASLCTSCQHQCTLCQHSYCAQCFLVGSEGSQVCVSCCG